MIERKSTLITETQFEAIHSNFDDLDPSQRSRLRDRIIDVLQDFSTLERLPLEETEKIFKKGFGGDLNRNREPEGDIRFEEALLDLHMFIWRGLQGAGWEPQQYANLLEDAIEQGEHGGLPLPELWAQREVVTQADVDIDVTRRYIPGVAENLSRLKEGKNLNNEDLGKAVKAVPREELINLVSQYTKSLECPECGEKPTNVIEGVADCSCRNRFKTY